MAGDWLKIEHATPDKPEIVHMADILGVDQNAVVGACLRLWIWADQQTSTGCALSVTRKWLDRLMQVNGAADAMIDVGWLTGVDGDLTLTNYNRHNGKPAKTRAQAAQRMKKARSQCDAPSATNVAQEAQPEKRRGEDRRGKSIKPASKQHQTGIKPASTAADIEAVYQAYPRHVGKRVAHKAIEKALKHIGYSELLAAVTEYAAAVSGSDKKFIPHPATWFNNHRWEDDRSEWKDEGRNGKPAAGTDATLEAAKNWTANVRRNHGPAGIGHTVQGVHRDGS
jgi:hypothetical protein